MECRDSEVSRARSIPGRGYCELAPRGRIKPELQRTLMAGLSAAELSALSMSLAQHFHVELAATPQLTIARVIDAAVGL